MYLFHNFKLIKYGYFSKIMKLEVKYLHFRYHKILEYHLFHTQAHFGDYVLQQL